MPFIDEITAETPVSMLTVGQLYQILDKAMNKKIEVLQAPPKHTVRGYKGLAKALDIGKATVAKWVRSGEFDPAITRTGRVISFDVDKVNEIRKAKAKTGGRNK